MGKDILYGQHRVEKINYNQRHLFSNLFSQRVNCQPPTVNACPAKCGGQLSTPVPRNAGLNGQPGTVLDENEPVLFIIWTRYAVCIPVGFVCLQFIGSSMNANPGTIVHDLFVLPDYRKNGAALKLVEAAVRFAIDIKSAFIQLETLRDNLSAKKLFESVGFKCQTPASGQIIYSIEFESNQEMSSHDY
jgi:hypothetical protein